MFLSDIFKCINESDKIFFTKKNKLKPIKIAKNNWMKKLACMKNYLKIAKNGSKIYQ